MNDVQPERSAGFTLIEVIVALAIMGIAVGVLFRVLSTQLSRTSDIEAETVATSLAQSLLADASASIALPNGDRVGDFQNGFQWRLHVASYGNSADRDAWPVGAKELSAEIYWRDGAIGRSIRLTTLRLMPKEAQP